MMRHKKMIITGTRGIPGRYGGFETFATELAPYLVQQGWDVTVYCQSDEANGPIITTDQWHGITRVHIAPRIGGAYGTILFDALCVLHALWHHRQSVWLVLGYNTACFNLLPRLLGIRQVINMDGMEWQRDKWSRFRRLYLRISYFIAGHAAHALVADHPEIERELRRDFYPGKIRMIPYGSPKVTDADLSLLEKMGVAVDGYALIIARPVPENGILEIVRQWAAKTDLAMKLVIVGKYDPANEHERQIMDFASDRIIFTGPIYDRPMLDALRFYAHVYFHGYRVGGTNPSLIEALGSGAGIIAHDNRFNRWVAGDAGRYYADEAALSGVLDDLAAGRLPIKDMRNAANLRHETDFRWLPVLEAYEDLLTRTGK